MGRNDALFPHFCTCLAEGTSEWHLQGTVLKTRNHLRLIPTCVFCTLTAEIDKIHFLR